MYVKNLAYKNRKLHTKNKKKKIIIINCTRNNKTDLNDCLVFSLLYFIENESLDMNKSNLHLSDFI